MLSKTKLKERTRRKTNPLLKETIMTALKNKEWHGIAHIISSSRKNNISINLDTIDSQTSSGDTIVVPGKILSKGEMTKKLKICALSISKKALEKIKGSKSEFVQLIEEIKKNPKATGIKLITQNGKSNSN